MIPSQKEPADRQDQRAFNVPDASCRATELHFGRKEDEFPVPLIFAGRNAMVPELYGVPAIGQIGRIVDDPAAGVRLSG